MEPLLLPVVVKTRPQVGCDPDLYLSERYVEVDIVDTRWDIRNLLGVVPGMFDETAAVPMTLPVDEEKDSQVEEGPDVVWTGRDMDMGDPDVGRDIQVLTDVGPMMIDGSDSGPLSLPVVANTATQVDIRWEATLEAVPFVVGGGCPTGWLDSESDGCVMDEIVLVPEMAPIVYMKSAVVPTFLPALFEVCSLAVLAGGSLLRQPRWQWLSQSQRECLSYRMLEVNFQRFLMRRPAYEVGNGALDVVGLSVGQSCLRMDSEDTLPALQDERSVMNFLIWPDAVLISNFLYRKMNVVMMDSYQGCMFVCLWSVTWTLIPFGWYIGKIAGPYLSGGECYVVLLDCLVCRSFGIWPV